MKHFLMMLLFCEWIDYSRTDELVRKGDELEEKDTFEFFLL
jgi:hypothetical protein